MSAAEVGIGARYGLGLVPTGEEKEYGTSQKAPIYKRLVEKLESTWICKKCNRFCPNCAGRSCTKCCVRLPPIPIDPDKKYLRSDVRDWPHAQVFFYNAVKKRDQYIVDPEWNSEEVYDQAHMAPTFINRPPWGWEQPRHYLNKRRPICYCAERWLEVKPSDVQRWPPAISLDFSEEPPPMSYHLSRYYPVWHPHHMMPY